MEENLYSIGIEREGLRCDKNGVLSQKAHPKAFADRMKNNFITTDWGEAQMELRTPVCKSTSECYEKLNEITNVVLCELNNQDELLWPYSMPCVLPNEENFPWGDYGTFIEEHEYEMYLYKKYGYKMHCMSGIHVNFSLNKTLFEKIKEEFNDLPDNIDDAYLKIMRVFLKKAWILIYLFGATPFKLDEDERSEISLRNSEKIGFKNSRKIEVDLSNKENYIASIENLISSGAIKTAKEVYLPIRAKSKHKNSTLKDLKSNQISHIEVRLCDINPFDKCGIDKRQMDITVLFLIKCLLENESNVNSIDYKQIAKNGLNLEANKELIEEIESYKEINKILVLDFEDSIDNYLNDLRMSSKSLPCKITGIAENEGKLNSILNLAKKYSQEAEKMRYKITGYPELEASTQILIKDAISRGIDYTIIDEKKSFVEFNNGIKRECIIQASKTSKDTYIYPFITDDKMYAKKIMIENEINTPMCICLNKKSMSDGKINKVIKSILGKKVVVKPKTTNYGDGITIIDSPAAEDILKSAVEYAFTFDSYVLIEEYVKGNEYRFLVIDGKCIHVSWRRRTSVVGNGINTIQELIKQKVNSPLYTRFERKIVINKPMLDYLDEQGYSLDYIPPKDERIFLHKVSNVSKGGEAVSVNEIMPEYYKKIAEKLVKAFNAKICGVDMIIDDLDSREYNVIELNDNPGILSNEYPVEGEGVKAGIEILKLLNLIED